MNPSSNALIAWVQENFLRLTSKSPAFFKVWKVITGIPVLIIALPNALQILNINLPQVFNQHVQDVVGWAATAMFLMAFLPTESKVVAIDQNGTPIKQTDGANLPFTSIKEERAIKKDKENPSTPSIDRVILENPVVDAKAK